MIKSTLIIKRFIHKILKPFHILKINRPLISKYFFLLSSMIIFFIVTPVLVSSALFFIKIPISVITLPLSFILTVLFLYYLGNKNSFSLRQQALVLMIFITILASGLIFSLHIWDTSYDGQQYHQNAIIHLSQGWNPIYEAIPVTVSSDEYVHLWVNHYPKASWIFGASWVVITGNSEYTKVINSLALIASFFLMISFLFNLERFGIINSLLISAILAFNPVTLCQLSNNYVDGLLGSLFLMLLCLSFMKYKDNYNYGISLLFLSCLILFVNIKYTGLVYSIFITPLFLSNDILSKNWPSLTKNSRVILFGYIIAVVIVGSTSYVKNFITKGHPFYPIFGKGKINIISNNTPIDLRPLNRFEKLYRSFFSESLNEFVDGHVGPTKVKVPFKLSQHEPLAFKNCDTRCAGFGPLFSGITFLAGFLLTVFFTFIIKKKMYRLFLSYFGLITLLFSSIIANPESWWARFSPQIWFIPIIIIIILIAYDYLITNAWLKNFIHLGTAIIIFLLMVNIGIISGVNFSETFRRNTNEKNFFYEIKAYNKPIKIELDGFEVILRHRLNRMGIKYQETSFPEDYEGDVRDYNSGFWQIYFEIE